MRLLYVSNLFPPDVVGGAEVVAWRHAQALAARGHQVSAFVGFRPSSPEKVGLLMRETDADLTVYRLGLRSLNPEDAFTWPLAERYFASVLETERPEVVHFHNLMGLGYGLQRIAAAFGAMTVATVHDHGGFCFRSTLLREDGSACDDVDACHRCKPLVEEAPSLFTPIRLRRDFVKNGLEQVDRLVFPSRYLRDVYQEAGFPRDRLSFISNGVDVQRFERSSARKGEVRFLALLYLGEHKGVPVLFDALRRLAADRDVAGRWSFTLGGDGHLRPFVDTQIRTRFGAGGAVRYLGPVARADVPDLFAETDVFVLTSIWPENEPVTLLESVAAGVAQLTTRVGGAPDLVEEGRSGRIVPPGDAEALYRAMRAYVLAPDEARAHGARNWARRAQVDETAAVDALEGLYGSGLGAPALRPPLKVVCVGEAAPEGAKALLENWPAVAPGGEARFVSSRWTPAEFDGVGAVWFWNGASDATTVLTALRAGVPVVAPTSARLAALQSLGAPVLLYDNWLEAAAALAGLVRRDQQGQTFAPAPELALNLFAESLDDEAFTLSA